MTDHASGFGNRVTLLRQIGCGCGVALSDCVCVLNVNQIRKKVGGRVRKRSARGRTGARVRIRHTIDVVGPLTPE